MTFVYVYMWLNCDMLFAKEVPNRRIEAALLYGLVLVEQFSYLSFNFASLQTYCILHLLQRRHLIVTVTATSPGVFRKKS